MTDDEGKKTAKPRPPGWQPDYARRTTMELAQHYENSSNWLLSDTGLRNHAVWIEKSMSIGVRKGAMMGSLHGCPVFEFTMPVWYAERKGLV